jgi:hypothetical protein
VQGKSVMRDRPAARVQFIQSGQEDIITGITD